MTESSSATISDLRGFEINNAPPDAQLRLPKGFAGFYAPLHARFTPWQQELVAKRKEALKAAHRGRKPHQDGG